MDDHTVIGRAVEVLDVAASADCPVRLAELTRLTGIPKPTVRRIAERLVHLRVLERCDDGYAAGPQLRGYAARIAERDLVAVRSAGHLQALVDRASVSAAFLVRTADLASVGVRGQVFDPASIALLARQGPWSVQLSRPAMLATAYGRVALAGRPAQVERLQRLGVPRLTPYSRVRPGELAAAMKNDAARGFAYENEQASLGWSCVAGAVGRVERPEWVVVAVSQARRFRLDRVAGTLVDTAAELAGDLSTATL